MVDNRLSKILHNAAREMRTEFEKSQPFEHKGEAGTVRQEIVREQVSRYLPRHLAVVNSAEIVTPDGNQSGQSDVVIYARNVPPILEMKSYRILPSESVLGVIEVKSKLDKPQLLDACEKIAKVKDLPKSAYLAGPEHHPDHFGHSQRQFTSGMIFAFGGTSIVKLGEHLLEWCDQQPLERWPHSVWVLGQGHLAWASPINGYIDPYPQPRSGLVAFGINNPDEDIFFALVLHLHILFRHAWVPPVDLVRYAGDDPLGKVVTTIRRPGPFLNFPPTSNP